MIVLGGAMKKLVWIATAVGLHAGALGIASAQDAPTPADAPPPEEPAPEPQKPEPWKQGVTAEKEDKARQLLADGNVLFANERHSEALGKYQAALAEYDHPKIRFITTRTLINLGRPLEALENIEVALKWGRDGLEEYFDDAQTYKLSLENQVATLQVSCTQAGVSITVDGQPFLSCPGEKSMRVKPGPHQVVGKKPGLITVTEDLVASGGQASPVAIKLQTFDEVAVTVRRWDRWKPWAVAGAGAVVGGAGVLLELQARSSRDEYAELLADNCSQEPCEADFGRSIFNRARLEHGIALSAMVVGGAAVVTGVAGVILNRPRQELPEGADQGRGPQVVPTVTGDSAGLSVSGTF
jgi:tetratricopeptide (TPR) repeat protein